MDTIESAQSRQLKRGGCLTAFLIFMLIVNPLVAIYYFVAGSSVAQALPHMPTWVIPVLGLGCLANFVFAIGIWKWKKWGMYGFAASAGIVFFINAIYINVLTALWGLVGVGLLAYLLRQAWSQME
jgi:mannose/fructose/N-acetylgalactosamine-specific phosphotransferase system component IIC